MIELLATIVGSPWLRAQLEDRTAFYVAFSAAGRKLGTQPISEAHAAAIRKQGWLVPRLGADEAGRAALVLAQLPHEAEPVAFVRDLVRRGEVRERQAVLRVLAALPEPERFVDIAVDACRTNVLDVFCAIACDNAYPARHFSDAQFAQMVLKALFVGAPLARVDRLAERTTDELVRMVEAYASERRAAGRAVPDDAKLVQR